MRAVSRTASYASLPAHTRLCPSLEKATFVTLAIPQRADTAVSANPAPLTPRRAYALLLLIYAVMFAAPAVLSIADFMTYAGLLPLRADDWIYRWDHPLYVRIPVAAWFVAVLLIDDDLTTSADTKRPPARRPRWSDTLSGRGRAAIRAAMAISCLLYAFAAWNADSLMRGQLLWRWAQIGPVLVLVLLALDRRGVTPAAIGLRRHRSRRDGTVARRAFTWSMTAIIASTVLGLLLDKIALHLDPRLLGSPAAGVPTPPLTAGGVAKMVLMSLSAGIGEETILSVLLVILMTSALQPRWRWLALAAALRVAFHLYTGIWGFGTVIFATANAAIFARTRRILPLIAAHTLFDVLGFLVAHVRLAIVLFGIDWLQLLVTLAAIPIVLFADHAISTLRGGAGAPAPRTQAGR
jgi:hypothetical protein